MQCLLEGRVVARMPHPLWLAGQAGDNLGHGDRQHCGQWRHQRLLAASSPSQRLLADGLSHQNGCRQVRDNHLAGKDRHSYGHQMMSGGPPASLPSRLTESMVWSEDRI